MADDVHPHGAPGVDRSWVDHLRAGGTTPWPRWVREAGRPTSGRPTAEPSSGLPGAAQLELLRRINDVGRLPHRVDHVLGRPGPGRGPVHLGLPTDPVGPAAPRREVLRVAAGVLADLVVQLPPVDAPTRARRRRPARGVPEFVLDGLPVTVAEIRAALVGAGIVEQRLRRSRFARPRGPHLVVVVAGRLDVALHEAWASRVQRGTARAWPRFVAQWSGRDRLPASAAVDATVAYWSDRVGADRVHLVPLVDDADPLRQVLDVLGQSADTVTGPGRVRDGDPVPLPPAALDAVRRVNAVLPFVCPSDDDQAARRTALLELVRDDHGRPALPDLPAKERGWASGAASRLVDALAGTGCVVHGDLDLLRSLPAPTGRQVGGDEVLDAMVRMIHRVDAALLGGPRDGRGGR